MPGRVQAAPGPPRIRDWALTQGAVSSARLDLFRGRHRRCSARGGDGFGSHRLLIGSCPGGWIKRVSGKRVELKGTSTSRERKVQADQFKKSKHRLFLPDFLFYKKPECPFFPSLQKTRMSLFPLSLWYNSSIGSFTNDLKDVPYYVNLDTTIHGTSVEGFVAIWNGKAVIYDKQYYVSRFGRHSTLLVKDSACIDFDKLRRSIKNDSVDKSEPIIKNWTRSIDKRIKSI
jgi:hypothetical protein